MANIKKNKIPSNEDTTLYGEFISSFDQWITPEKQRERSEYLAEITGEISPEIMQKKNRQKISDSNQGDIQQS